MEKVVQSAQKVNVTFLMFSYNRGGGCRFSSTDLIQLWQVALFESTHTKHARLTEASHSCSAANEVQRR